MIIFSHCGDSMLLYRENLKTCPDVRQRLFLESGQALGQKLQWSLDVSDAFSENLLCLD
jgi:hypothetical protein